MPSDKDDDAEVVDRLNQVIVIDGEERVVIPCPDDREDCEVLHLAPLSEVEPPERISINLTEADVIRIRRLYADGVKPKAIREMLHLPFSLVDGVLFRGRWKSVKA